MTKMSFFNGLKEIGGTFVAIETDKAVCMFDFGFAVQKNVDGKIFRRKKSFAADYIRLGMLTPFDGIYDEKTAKKTGLKAYGQTDKKTFFVISHMHIDHMGGLGSLAKEVPVYMSEDSLKLYNRLAENDDIQDAFHENCIGIPYGEKFSVEDITVEVIQIDHDVIGACGFLISTPDGKVCYTGDYRFHGYHPENTREFANKCKGADYLITEGVSLSFDDVDILSLEEPEKDDKTEYGLLNKMTELSQSEKGLIVINPYNRNVERIHNLINTLAKSGRKLVLDKVAADYVYSFYPEDEIYVYAPTSKRLKDYDNFKLVHRKEIKENPEKYCLQLDYQNQFELLDLKKIVSLYVHMDGAPLGDYDPSFAKMLGFLEMLKIPYSNIGLSGHAKPYYIRWMIDTISPKALIPLHSFRPEQVNSKNIGKRILPEYGDSITF